MSKQGKASVLVSIKDREICHSVISRKIKKRRKLTKTPPNIK